MFVYQNVLENPKILKETKDDQTNNPENITLIFNEQIKVYCPKENAIYLSKKIKKILNSTNSNEIDAQNYKEYNPEKNHEDQLNEESENAKESENMYSVEGSSESFIMQTQQQKINNELHIIIDELNQSPQQNNTSSGILQEELDEIKQENEFFEVQLTLLFNGFDVAISHKYLKKFKAICKKLQISTFLKQLSDYFDIPNIHEMQHEITVLRTLENFFSSLAEDNIENMTHQVLSLYYQTRPEFFCLILLNQCLIQSKSIELFVYLFEETLIKIDEFNPEKQESELLKKMLENIIRKSLKFEGTYGPYKPESDVAHEMFPQEYFYLCQLLYSRNLISYKLFQESFINANWVTMSAQSQDIKLITTENVDIVKIFITKDQYITIQDFTYDFSDKKCRYKHMCKESVEELIKSDESKFIHKINNINNNNDNNEYVNWISLYLEGENPDSIAELIKKDDIETFQRFVNSNYRDLEEFIEKYGTIRRSIYERKSIVNKNLTLIEFASFYGSVKCFKYLLINECRLDKAAKYAVAGSNSEIIHICQQHKATFEGSLLLSIRYHRWEITEWLLETLNVKFNSIAVLKLCISCGNFISMHFIIEKILSQKSGSKDFINEIIVVQSMYYLKYRYGFLMTKYKVGVTITFDDNKAIFWHEHFFSYIFDYIKPKEIKIQDRKENNENKESQENNENKDSQENNENKESQENNENKDSQENNENQGNHENNENKGNHENNENKDRQENNENQGNHENKEIKENHENNDKQENQVNHENNENEESNENNENQSNDENKEIHESTENNDNQDRQENDCIHYNNKEMNNNNLNKNEKLNIEIDKNRNEKDNDNDDNSDDYGYGEDENGIESYEGFDFDYDEEDEINEAIRKMRPKVFYELAPEMIELIYILQNHFFQINSIPYRSLSPLHVSIQSNDLKLYELILMHTEIDLNYNTYEYPSPILYSIKMRNETIFDLLYKNEKVKLNGSSSTVAFIANQYDIKDEESTKNDILLRMLSRLLQTDRFDPNVGTSFTPQGIFNAYERHEYRVLDLLSSSPLVDLNVRDLKGYTLLHLSILDNDTKMFDILLKNKKRVDLNLQTRIIQKNDSFIAGPKMDKTPLMLCIEKLRFDFFDRLINEDEVSIEICDINHETITMIMCKNKCKYRLDVLKKLYNKKKEEFLKTLMIEDSNGKMPLSVVIDNRDKNVEIFLRNCQK